MELPQIRAGRVVTEDPKLRVIAFFYSAAQGNCTIQLVTTMGVASDQLGVTPPERTGTGQGMLLSIPCADERMAARVEAVCRQHGAEIHRQRR